MSLERNVNEGDYDYDYDCFWSYDLAKLVLKFAVPGCIIIVFLWTIVASSWHKSCLKASQRTTIHSAGEQRWHHGLLELKIAANKTSYVVVSETTYRFDFDYSKNIINWRNSNNFKHRQSKLTSAMYRETPTNVCNMRFQPKHHNHKSPSSMRKKNGDSTATTTTTTASNWFRYHCKNARNNIRCNVSYRSCNGCLHIISTHLSIHIDIIRRDKANIIERVVATRHNIHPRHTKITL